MTMKKNERFEMQCNKVINARESKNKKSKCDKSKGKVEDEKELGVVKLFYANYDGFGPCSESKSHLIKEISTVRNRDRSMISSSDTGWNVKNETNMVRRFKNASENSAINTSDSGEETDHSGWFLKVDTVTALWSSIDNCVEVDCMCEQEHGWRNAVIVTGNRNKVALIIVHVILNRNTVGENSSKAQNERTIGKVMSAKTIRN